MDDVDIEVDIKPSPGTTHVIIPCTYAPEREGRFELTVTALAAFTFQEYQNTVKKSGSANANKNGAAGQ